jgi:hypothetical protein
VQGRGRGSGRGEKEIERWIADDPPSAYFIIRKQDIMIAYEHMNMNNEHGLLLLLLLLLVPDAACCLPMMLLQVSKNNTSLLPTQPTRPPRPALEHTQPIMAPPWRVL